MDVPAEPVPGDIAQYPEPEPGPPPVVRALLGLLLGAAAGLVAVLVTPRPEHGAPTAPPGRPGA